jgi:hypothetical protein
MSLQCADCREDQRRVRARSKEISDRPVAIRIGRVLSAASAERCGLHHGSQIFMIPNENEPCSEAIAQLLEFGAAIAFVEGGEWSGNERER